MLIMLLRRGRLRSFGVLACLAVAMPLFAANGSSAGADSRDELPPGLQPKVVRVSNDFAYLNGGEPEVAVNPKNPNNLVYVATRIGDTPACQISGNPNCQLIPTTFGPMPAGTINNVLDFPTSAGFSPSGIFVSFDRGNRWTSVTVPTIPPPYPDTGPLLGGDPAISVAPNGTFIFSEDVVNFINGFTTPTIARDAGIAVSVSTDGGRTWSTPVLSGTAADRDFMAVDASTGTIYLESGATQLGTASTLNPSAPNTGPAGRFLVASTDGAHWTAPAYLGAGISGPYISAARGVLATGGRTTSATLCDGTPPVACELLQTTTDKGLTWSRHVIPNSSDSSGGPLIAADPTTAGHFTVAYLNAANTALNLRQTHDYGNTWSDQAVITEDAGKTHWKPWLAYSSEGRLGLMWRTWQGSPNTSPYNIWAAVSADDAETLSKPLEVSNGDSPAPYPKPFPTFGDDFSNIALSGDNLFVAWADWRVRDTQGLPSRQGFLSTVKLQAFTFHDSERGS
jgi:hypothetical protein